MNSIKIIIAILSFGLFSCQGQETGKVEQLDAKTFSEKITSSNDIQLLDVRTPGEFQDQHIDHATNINWNGANFEKEVAVLDKSKPVYIYCKSGGRSNQAAHKLAEMGYTKIYELNGGMMKWNAAGLSEKSNKTIGMTKEDFNKLLISDKKVLVDFYAEWCAPCKKMEPYLKKMTEEMPEKVKIIRINADENTELCKTLNVSALPVLKLYKNEKIVWENLGFVDEQQVRTKIEQAHEDEK